MDDIYVKSAMIARLGTVLQCRSGVHTDVVKLLVEFINHEIYPFIPMHGSVGASGDLVQLAHIALCLIGEGEVHYKGEWRSSAEVMKQLGLTPLKMRIREGLSAYPGDVRRKKLAGELLLMAQAGQYNYTRCLKHGETGAAQLAVAEYTKAAMHTAFLLNGAYMPYYKWSFRALRQLPVLGDLADAFEYLISTGNTKEEAGIKAAETEKICIKIAKETAKQGFAEETSDMERMAYAVNEGIKDPNIRSLSIFYTV